MEHAQVWVKRPLFDILPVNFFSPLSSPNRLVYWECLCRLFSTMNEQLSFGVERDILVDELQFYFEQDQAAEFEDDEINALDPRKKANEMLRLLEKYGWLEVETDKSYVQRVNFYDYAVKVMKTLFEIADGKKVEYQGYIYTIYSLVRTSTDHPAVVLQQIRENTDMLITGLKNLNSNIKHYIDELTRHKTVAEIMDALFNDYITNIVDKAYHRLLTSDNVSKFRPEIIERLETWGHSKVYISETSEELSALREISKEQAEELVYQTLHDIIDAFRSMDDILAEINQKNTQYQRAAVNRAKFLLAGTEDVRGQLKEIMIYKTPGYVYIKGTATLVTPAGDEICVGAFPDGIGFALGHTQEACVHVVPDASVREVYTIENLTSFYRFQREDSLIVYLGGYHNSVRRQLLLDIYHALPEAQYYHFGDIDAGGFQIFYHLREKTGIPFQTYQMDLATLMAYEDYAKPLTDSDRKRLKLLCETKFADAEKCVAEYMLAKGIKLEQECVGR